MISLDESELDYQWRKTGVVSWDQIAEIIEAVSHLPRGWNSQGKSKQLGGPLSPELRAHAIAAADCLRDVGANPPDVVNLAPCGTMYFKWSFGDSYCDYFVGGEHSGLFNSRS